MARRSSSADSVEAEGAAVTAANVAGSAAVGWQQCERDVGPRSLVDPAVGDHLAVVVELELAAHEPVGELAGFDGERADVAGDLLARLVEPAPEHHLEHPAAADPAGAEDQGHQVRRDRHRRRARCGLREHHPGEVDARRRAWRLTHLEVLGEQRRDDVHAVVGVLHVLRG